MSIANAISYLNRLETTTEALLLNYQDNQLACVELNKLSKDTTILKDYLLNLDRLKPKYNTDQLNELLKPILLHLAILKVEIEKKDFVKLKLDVRLIKTMLKFHPTKYSFFAFITAWFLEWLYFI